MSVADSREISRLCAECPIRSFTFCRTGHEGDARPAPGIRHGIAVRRKGRTLYRQGDTGSEIYILREGWAFRYSVLADGRRQISGIMARGDLVLLPLLFVPRLPYSVHALTDTVLCAFRASDVMKLCRTVPSYAHQLEAACVTALVIGESRLADLNQRTAQERTAWFLLSHYREFRRRGLAEGPAVRFPLRLAHIADALGLTVTHVSRTLAALKRDGLITLSHDRLIVHSERELAAVAVLPQVDAWLVS